MMQTLRADRYYYSSLHREGVVRPRYRLNRVYKPLITGAFFMPKRKRNEHHTRS